VRNSKLLSILATLCDVISISRLYRGRTEGVFKPDLNVGRVVSGVALVSATLGLGIVLIATASNGDSHGSQATNTLGSVRRTDRETYPGVTVVAEIDWSRSSPTAAPAPETPAPSPQEGTGGDQSSGPLPQTSGNIPENVNASPEFLALRDQLESSIQAYDAEVGGVDVAIAVTDLQNGETISVGGNVLHRTGCVINLFALLGAVNEFQAGNASPDGLGYSIKKGIGGSYPPEVKNFTQSIFGSYWDGTYHARSLMSSWGMTASYFDHIPYYGGESPSPNILTALETNDVLAKLWNEQLFDYEWTVYTLRVLRDSYSYVNYILPGRLPSGATVGHKIGYYADWDGWVNNDVGIVTFQGADGVQKAYAITYFSQLANSERIGYSFGAKLSRDVWDWMVGKYGLWTPPPPPTPEPTPEPTPSPTLSPTPEPTVTPTASPEPLPTKTPKH
jgi:Beta-lactamase enzyme family